MHNIKKYIKLTELLANSKLLLKFIFFVFFFVFVNFLTARPRATGGAHTYAPHAPQ